MESTNTKTNIGMKWINFEYSKAATRGVLRNFTKFSGKHLCQGLQSCSATLLKKGLWYLCFPVNFPKFLRTSFLQNTSGRLLLIIAHLSKVDIDVDFFGFVKCHLSENRKVACNMWMCNILNQQQVLFRILSNIYDGAFSGKLFTANLQGLNPLSANPTKWSNTLEQFAGKSRQIVCAWPLCEVGA